jgi:hypothetical protein
MEVIGKEYVSTFLDNVGIFDSILANRSPFRRDQRFAETSLKPFKGLAFRHAKPPAIRPRYTLPIYRSRPSKHDPSLSQISFPLTINPSLKPSREVNVTALPHVFNF